MIEEWKIRVAVCLKQRFQGDHSKYFYIDRVLSKCDFAFKRHHFLQLYHSCWIDYIYTDFNLERETCNFTHLDPSDQNVVESLWNVLRLHECQRKQEPNSNKSNVGGFQLNICVRTCHQQPASTLFKRERAATSSEGSIQAKHSCQQQQLLCAMTSFYTSYLGSSSRNGTHPPTSRRCSYTEHLISQKMLTQRFLVMM